MTIVLVAVINIDAVKDGSVVLNQELRFWMVLVTVVSLVACYIVEAARHVLLDDKIPGTLCQRQLQYTTYVRRLLQDDLPRAMYGATVDTLKDTARRSFRNQGSGASRLSPIDAVRDDKIDAKNEVARLNKAQAKAQAACDKAPNNAARDALEREVGLISVALAAALEEKQRQKQRMAYAKKFEAARLQPEWWQVGTLKTLVVHVRDAVLGSNTEAFTYPTRFLASLQQ